jgi:hypothetical protein
MQRLPWIERRFQFDIPSGWLWNVSARLAGTVARVRSVVDSVSEDHLRNKPAGKWSIKEHIGHLSDLEDLHLQRLTDFKSHTSQLSVWDKTNTATETANHNDKPIAALIAEFDAKRRRFVDILMALDDATQAFQSIHPRLKVPMKPVDMATFVAEHDDHHIASLIALKDGEASFD